MPFLSDKNTITPNSSTTAPLQDPSKSVTGHNENSILGTPLF